MDDFLAQQMHNGTHCFPWRCTLCEHDGPHPVLCDLIVLKFMLD